MHGLIDTHTHLESFHRKGNLDAALQAAEDAGLKRLVTIGTDSSDWGVYAELASKYSQVEYTVGIHPCSVEASWETQAEQIEVFWSGATEPVGLGEIGLDRFHLPKDTVEADRIIGWQKDAFRWQLQLAKKLGTAVVVHSRGAFEESVQIIDESGIDWQKVVFHCFSEGPGEMKQLMDRGGRGSFTGIITFKNAESIRDAARLQGMERMMVETDAPYLAPMPHRGKPNEPAFLAHTARYCAELFGLSEEAFARVSSENAEAFYSISS